MITDLFVYRYQGQQVFEDSQQSYDRAIPTLVQAFRIIGEQVLPPYDRAGQRIEPNMALWSEVQRRLSMELGIPELASACYPGSANQRNDFERCRAFMSSELREGSVDAWAKARWSLVELALKLATAHFEHLAANHPRAVRGATLESGRKYYIEPLRRTIAELNERMRRADFRFHFHNGILQHIDDELTQREIESPFWQMVADAKWRNVDTDMKEALDLRDNGGRDPAFYAARALESAIKIISDDRGFTRGNERGAANYIDNLNSAANGRFIENWEAEQLRRFFADVRNPMGHGPGAAPMPAMTPHQVQQSIEFAMAWIKSLLRRL